MSKRTTPPSRLSKTLATAAPLVCLGLLAVMNFSRDFLTIPVEDITAYHLAIQEAAEDIPYRIGQWDGIDQDITPAARELLKPNVLFQRQYNNPDTGYSLSLMIVHCGSMDDMGGHYPPVCYPAMGWHKTEVAETTITVGPKDYDASNYGFERSFDGIRREIWITDFFIVPSDEPETHQIILNGLDDVRHIGEFRQRKILGVGQIQIVTDREMPADVREKAVAEVLDAVRPLIHVIGDGIQ